ncbi:MAG: glycosyltransferase family 4 protein [Patescibacteria group bacterium]|jgi:glycosyltransferase involved in cell wall biosynthesis
MVVKRMALKKLNILIIAHLDDFPTNERPVAGMFIKEFVDGICDSCNYRVMLVGKVFLSIGFRTQLKQLLSLMEKLFKGTLFYKKNSGQNKCLNQGREFILPVFYPIVRILGRPVYFLSGLSLVLMAKRVLMKSGFKPDVIQTFKSFPSAYIGWKLRQKFHVPVINIEYQGPFSSYCSEPYCMERALAAIRNVDVTVHSRFQIGVIKKYGVSENKLRYWHFGVDTEQFVWDEKSHLKRKTEMEEKRFKLLVIGRVEEAKGLKYLIGALLAFVDKYPEICLSIVGPRGDCLDWVMMTIEQQGLEKNVECLGEVQHEELPGVINSHDVIIVASLFETFGLTIVEALSCGKPVVATRCGGPEEIVDEDVGVLVPARDSAALAKGIEYVIQNYQKYDPIKIRKYAVDNYDHRIMLGKLFKLYDEFSLKG